MTKSLILLTIALSSSFSFAETQVSTTCEEALQKNIIKQANDFLKTTLNEEKIDLEVRLNSKKNKINLSITGKDDGLYLRFEAPVTEADIQTCNIQPKLAIEDSCQYSNYGENDFDEIDKLFVGLPLTILNDKEIDSIQKEQLRKLLIYGDEKASLNDLIAETDDGEVIYALVTLPNGQKLDYYKTYGGDNPYGAFYYEGTTKVAGTNSDDSICIAFPQ